MTPESTLPVIAQIAATFAGFTALVSVVDQGQDGRWARISIWQIAVGTVVVIGSLNWSSSFKMTRKLSMQEGPSLNQTVRRTNMTLGFSGLCIQLVSLTGLFPLNLSGVYLLSMTIILMITSLVFFALIQQLDLQRLEGEEKTVDEETA